MVGPVRLGVDVVHRAPADDARDGGGVDDALDRAGLFDRVQHVLGGHEASVVDLALRHVTGALATARVVALEHRRDVEDRRAAGEDLVVVSRREQVRRVQRQLAGRAVRVHRQQVRGLERVGRVADAAAHGVAGIDELQDDGGAHVARGAGDGDRGLGAGDGGHLAALSAAAAAAAGRGN